MAGVPAVILVFEMALQMEVTQYSSKRERAFVFDPLDCVTPYLGLPTSNVF